MHTCTHLARDKEKARKTEREREECWHTWFHIQSHVDTYYQVVFSLEFRNLLMGNMYTQRTHDAVQATARTLLHPKP